MGVISSFSTVHGSPMSATRLTCNHDLFYERVHAALLHCSTIATVSPILLQDESDHRIFPQEMLGAP